MSEQTRRFLCSGTPTRPLLGEEPSPDCLAHLGAKLGPYPYGTLTLVHPPEGAAEAYRDRHARWQDFTDAQRAAAEADRGLWGAC